MIFRGRKLNTKIIEQDLGLGGLIQSALVTEADAIRDFANTPRPELAEAVEAIVSSQSQLIVAGIGKSGHIARKVASTFRSIGKSAVYLHPSEASHGDLGLVQSGSIVLVLSNSGETRELSDLLHFCATTGVRIIAITGHSNSTLSRAAEIAICFGSIKEACPNGLAPTTSTTLSLAICDALAAGVTHLLGTAPEDFQRFHPAGSLGARLTRVSHLMHSGASLPKVQPDTPMTQAVAIMSEKAFGVALVMDREEVVGIVTDGDLRRHAPTLWNSTAKEIATPNPVYIESDMFVTEAVRIMSSAGITSGLVRDDKGKFVGLLHMHDCLRLGLGV